MNKLKKHTIIFILADVINKAIPFLILPILTKYLGASDYGILSVYNSLLSFVQVVIGFSIVGYLNLNYFKISFNDRRQLISTAISFFIILAILNIIIGLFFFRYILNEINTYWAVIISLTGFLYNINNLNLSIWILEQRSIKFSIFQITETFLKVILSLFLIISIGMNWGGRAYGILGGTLIMGISSIYILKSKGFLIASFNRDIFFDIYKFGSSLFIHQISNWLKQNVDKFLILLLLGKFATGVYAVAFQFGLVLGIFTSSINKSWVPYFYKTIDDKSKESNLIKLIILYVPFILLVAFLLSFVFKMVLQFFFQSEFLEAANYIPFLLLAYCFQGMYFMVVNYMFYFRKNRQMSFISTFTTVFQVIVMFFAIKEYGLLGAVVSFSATYFLLFSLTALYVIYISKQDRLEKNGV